MGFVEVGHVGHVLNLPVLGWVHLLDLILLHSLLLHALAVGNLDIVSGCRNDLTLDVSLLLAWDPAILLGIIWRGLSDELPLVHSQVLEIGVVGIVRHVGRLSGTGNNYPNQ